MFDKRDKLVGLLLLLITLALYWPSIDNDFITIDDDVYVTRNEHVLRGLTCENIVWAFKGDHAAFWHPITWLSLQIDSQIFGGLNPQGYHITALLLHCFNVVFLFFLLKKMTNATWASAVIAALFGWHPLHVESVAWIAERKDVLSTSFWLITMWSYLGYVAEPSRSKYWRTLGFFTVGLMSKPMLVTLPCVLLLIDYWPLKRITDGRLATVWRLIVEKLPFFGLATVASVLAVVAQKKYGGMPSDPVNALPARTINALVSYGTYLQKMIWPRDLGIMYLFPKAFNTTVVLLTFVCLLGITFLLVKIGRKRFPVGLVGWFWYLGTLVPVLGIVQINSQSMADRYTYVPLIGIFLLVVFGLIELFGTTRSGRIILAALASISLVGCAVMTRIQLGYWKDSITLYEHTLAITGENRIMEQLLGDLWRQRGEYVKAKSFYVTSLRHNLENARAHFGLGLVLLHDGNSAEAIEEFELAVALDEKLVEGYRTLGVTLMNQKRFDEAEKPFTKLLELSPKSATAHNALGIISAQRGQTTEALEHFQNAAQINPDAPDIYRNLAKLLSSMGREEEAKRNYERALMLKQKQSQAKSE